MKKNLVKIFALVLMISIFFITTGCQSIREDRLNKTYELMVEEFGEEKVSQSLDFPTSFNGVDLIWESSRPDVINNKGELTLPDKEAVVNVKLTLKYGLSEKEHLFTFIVEGIN